MLKKRLENTKRELSAMRTMRMHTSKQGENQEEEEAEHKPTPRITQVLSWFGA